MHSFSVKRGYFLLDILQLKNTKRYETFLPKFFSKNIEGQFYLDHKESAEAKNNEIEYGDEIIVYFYHEI